MAGMLDASLSTPHLWMLGLSLLIACGFEFVNGFHDTANAVATVIYTRSLRPWTAVVWSGVWNFLGVFAGGIAVAVSIIKLLPAELLMSGNVGASLAMVLALLLSAVMWNLGTWMLGLPASSSHTLIGAILGVGLAHSLLPGHTFGAGVNWGKAGEVFLSLLVSPVFGFGVAGALVWLARRYLTKPELHSPPRDGAPPPRSVRALLVATCTGVSFAHGSNDGQKGVGLVMLILIALVPGAFALDPSAGPERLQKVVTAASHIEQTLAEVGRRDGALASADDALPLPTGPAAEVAESLALVRQALAGKDSPGALTAELRREVRQRILRADAAVDKLLKAPGTVLTEAQRASLKAERAQLRAVTDYAPSWVLVVVALSLGLGTMVGWKRIVVTVGEKIGQAHLTYAQGASAELVAMSTIGVAAFAGLPVSTTHVLSSGVAGSMVAHKAGLQVRTVRNILLAWALTLPAAALIAALLFRLLYAVLA